MNYEYLEDIATADIAFKARGKTLEELFASSARAEAENPNTKTKANTIFINILS